MACSLVAREQEEPETVSQTSANEDCEQDRRRGDSPTVTLGEAQGKENRQSSSVESWCLQMLRLEKTQWSGFELGRRKLGNGRSRGCKCWCAGKRKGQGWKWSRDDDDAKLYRY